MRFTVDVDELGDSIKVVIARGDLKVSHLIKSKRDLQHSREVIGKVIHKEFNTKVVFD